MGKISSPTNPRNQLSVTVLNDKIYIIGGQYNHDLQQLDQPLVHICDASRILGDGPSLPMVIRTLRALPSLIRTEFGWWVATQRQRVAPKECVTTSSHLPRRGMGDYFQTPCPGLFACIKNNQ